jgi:hypothetical protein
MGHIKRGIKRVVYFVRMANANEQSFISEEKKRRANQTSADCNDPLGVPLAWADCADDDRGGLYVLIHDSRKDVSRPSAKSQMLILQSSPVEITLVLSPTTENTLEA